MKKWSDLPSLWADTPDNWELLERRRISGGGSISAEGGFKATGGSVRISGGGELSAVAWRKTPRDITITVHAPIAKQLHVKSVDRAQLDISGPLHVVPEETTINGPTISSIETKLVVRSGLVAESPIKRALTVTYGVSPIGPTLSVDIIGGILSIEKPLPKSTITSVELVNVVQTSVSVPIIDRE